MDLDIYFFHEKTHLLTSESSADHEHGAVSLLHDNGSALSLTRKPDFAMVKDRNGEFLSVGIKRIQGGQTGALPYSLPVS